MTPDLRYLIHPDPESGINYCLASSYPHAVHWGLAADVTQHNQASYQIPSLGQS